MRTLLIAVLLVAMAISLKIDHECGIYNPNLPLPDQAIHSAEKTDISEDKLKEIQKFLEKSDP